MFERCAEFSNVQVFTFIYSGFEGQCQLRLDLCLIIDSSGSVKDRNPDNWRLQLEFFADLVASFPIGQDNTRVAAIVFSEEVRLVFSLNRFNTLSEVQQAILSVPYMGQTTNTPEAFRVADIECFSAVNGDRDDADNVIIIATDGVPFPEDRRTPAVMEAIRLKDQGVDIIAVGVTNFVDEDFLRGISSRNSYTRVTDFEGLTTQIEQIYLQTCEITQIGKHCVYQGTITSTSWLRDCNTYILG